MSLAGGVTGVLAAAVTVGTAYLSRMLFRPRPRPPTAESGAEKQDPPKTRLSQMTRPPRHASEEIARSIPGGIASMDAGISGRRTASLADIRTKSPEGLPGGIPEVVSAAPSIGTADTLQDTRPRWSKCGTGHRCELLPKAAAVGSEGGVQRTDGAWSSVLRF